MPLTVNTNISSLNAQNKLGKTQNALGKSLERLSSGLRINSAKDDAAGLGISTRMNSQIRGLNQAVRNANDGISMVQTAEGAMSEVNDLLQRMREIAVQSSNDTNSASDRKSLQSEMDQLYSEIDRISNSTSFNGVNLLDGTAKNKSFQIGANAGQTMTISIGGTKTNDLNLNGYSAIGELNGGRVGSAASAAGDLKINDVSIGVSAADTTMLYGADEAIAKAVAINAKSSETGVTAEAYNVVKGTNGATGITSGLTIQVGTANAITIADSGSIEELAENINRDANGVTATVDAKGALVLSNDDGKNIIVGGTTTGSGLTGGTYRGYISLTDDDNEKIEVEGANGASALNRFGLNESTGSSKTTGGSVTTDSLASSDLVTINGVVIGASSSSSAGDKAAAINAVVSQTGVRASAKTEVNSTGGTGAVTGTGGLIINGVDIYTANGGAATTDMEDLVTAINGNVQGVHASLTTDGNLTLTSDSGLDIVIDGTDTATTGFTNATTRGELTLTSESGADIIIDSNANGESNKDTAVAKLGLVRQGGSSDAVGKGLSVETQENSQNAIKRIDEAIAKVAEMRGGMGAIQNRLESSISNTQNVSQNLSAANGRIVDADFASETANLSKQQILSQAGTAMLAQANQLGQGVLSLLG